MAAAVLAALLPAAVSAKAADSPWPPELWWPPRIDDATPDTGFAAFGPDAAPWLPAALARLTAERTDHGTVKQVALLHGAGTRTYLAVGWDVDNGGTVDVHVVDASGEGPPHLRRVRTVADDWAEIVMPTGTRPFADLPPMLAIYHDCICSGPRGSMRLILLTGDTIDITPDWAGATQGLSDLDGDGIPEAVTIDDNWHGFPYGCGGCGPDMPVVLRRQAGRFVFACTDFAAIYRATIDALPPPPDPITAPWENIDAMEVLSLTALRRAQIGDFPAAFRAARQLQQAADSFYAQSPEPWNDHLPVIAADMADAIEAAHDAFTGTGCPLSEVNPYLAFRRPEWLDGF